MANTKYGRQPFMDMILKSGTTYRKAAAKMGVPYLHLRHAGYGYVRPKVELRDRLVGMFGVDLDQLFTGESLASVPHYGEKGRRLMVEAEAARDLQEEQEKLAGSGAS